MEKEGEVRERERERERERCEIKGGREEVTLVTVESVLTQV